MLKLNRNRAALLNESISETKYDERSWAFLDHALRPREMDPPVNLSMFNNETSNNLK